MKRTFTLIELMIVIAIIAIVAAIAIPNLLAAKKSANEASAIGSIRAIATAESVYVERSASQTYSDSLATLSNAGFIDEVLGSGSKEGYLFSQQAGSGGSNFTSPSAGVSADTAYNYTATADPRTSDTGDRYFFVDQSGVIRFNIGDPAVASSNPLGKK